MVKYLTGYLTLIKENKQTTLQNKQVLKKIVVKMFFLVFQQLLNTTLEING